MNKLKATEDTEFTEWIKNFFNVWLTCMFIISPYP